MLLMGRNVAHSMIPLDAVVKFSLTMNSPHKSEQQILSRCLLTWLPRVFYKLPRMLPQTLCHSELEDQP